MRCYAWLALFLLSLPTSAMAQSGATRADVLFRQGRTAMEREDYAEACPKFAESAKLDPAAGTILNLAHCEEQLGQIGRALTHYRVALALLPPDDDRVRLAEEHAQALEPRVAKLTLVLPADAPEGAKVFRDGEEIERSDLGVEDPVDPGTHQITLQVPGNEDINWSILLREGESQTLTLKGRESSSVVGTPTSGNRATLGFIVGGIGAASLATSLVLGAVVLGKKATVDSSCHGGRQCDTQEGVDAAESGAVFSTMSTITFFAGIAALGVGTILVLTADKQSGSATAIVPIVSPYGGGLQVWRHF